MNILAPWEVALSDGQHSIILFFLVLAGLALFAQTIRAVFYGASISDEYKPAAVSGVAVTGVAFLSYVILVISFATGYSLQDGLWVPNYTAEWSYAARYAEWAVSVPLLIIQLFTVSGFASRRKNMLQGIAVTSAFLMVFTGYIGGVVVDGGRNLGALWTWGLISTFFFAIVYAVVIYSVIQAMPKLSDKAKVSFRNAMVILLVTWMIYPMVFGLQGFTQNGTWTMVSQIALCVADFGAKIGFGTFLFKVARQRTEDESGHSTHKAGSV